MDKHLADIARVDGDLLVSASYGFAYQIDQSQIVNYDESYFDKCKGYEGKEIARKINSGRVHIVAKHFDPLAPLLDIGIGSGEFIKHRPNTWGIDVNPTAVDWLKATLRYSCDLESFKAFTMWDVIEHVPTPADYFDRMPYGSCLFTSIPIYQDIAKVRESKHYRPGEHLYHFTDPGFRRWMGEHGFQMIDRQTFEMEAGRDSIYTYAFRKLK